MNNPNLIVAPVVCDKQTDLGPFFESCLNDAVKNKCAVYSSLTFETNFNDPLAILEQVHESGHTICFFEKQSEEFSVACGLPVAEANFDGSHRFEKAKVWSQNLLLKTKIAGDTRIEGTGPTLFPHTLKYLLCVSSFLTGKLSEKVALISLLSIARLNHPQMCTI